MEYLLGVSIWFTLIWTSGAILGYIYANEHGRPKKQKRDARGRFVGKGNIDLAHYDISIWGSKRASYPGKLDGWRTPKTQKEECHTAKGGIND